MFGADTLLIYSYQHIGCVDFDKINDELKMENSFRLSNSFFEYDEVSSATNDKDTGTKNLEASLAVKLIHEKNKFKNKKNNFIREQQYSLCR